MIYAYQVYETVLDLCRKDLRGRGLSVEEYNNTAKVVNQIVFNKYYGEFESTEENSEAMSAFKVTNEAIAIGLGGIGALPTRYYHVVGMPRYVDTGGVTRFLDLVSSLEHAKREQDYLTKATLTHPTYRLGIATTTSDMTMYVTPTTGIATVYMDYLRTPDVPFLDYYLNDTTANYTWMDAGDTVAVPSGSTARNGTTGLANVASATVDWEWDEDDLPMIVTLFLKQLGISLPSAELYQGGSLQEDKLDIQ